MLCPVPYQLKFLVSDGPSEIRETVPSFPDAWIWPRTRLSSPERSFFLDDDESQRYGVLIQRPEQYLWLQPGTRELRHCGARDLPQTKSKKLATPDTYSVIPKRDGGDGNYLRRVYLEKLTRKPLHV